MGGFLGSLWESSKNEGDTNSCGSGSDSENWLEEIEKDYGHPSWSQLIGKRLSRKRKTVKVIKCSEETKDKSDDVCDAELSKELKRLESEVKEELGVIHETPEELDNVRNTLEELGDKTGQGNGDMGQGNGEMGENNESWNDGNVASSPVDGENVDTGNEVNMPNSPVDIEQVGMDSLKK